MSNRRFIIFFLVGIASAAILLMSKSTTLPSRFLIFVMLIFLLNSLLRCFCCRILFRSH